MTVYRLSKFILLISMFIFITQPLYAQFEFGFRTETQILKYKTSDGGSSSTTSGYPSCLQLTLGYYPIKNIAAEVRAGKEFGLLDLTDFYYGFECGIYGKYFPIKSLYLTTGLAYHSNDAEFIHNGGSRLGSNILMPVFGLGVKPWNHVGFEGLYQLADNQLISGSWYGGYYLTSIIKIGVVCTW